MKRVVRFLVGAPFLPFVAIMAWAFNDPDEIRELWRFIRHGQEKR